MPGLITHYICGEAIFKKLESNNKEIISNHRQLYNIGTQGPDIFFYYLPGLLNRSLSKLGTIMHTENFQLFISNIIDEIDNIKENKDSALSYLCGYLTHYALDFNTHPYIYYHSGFRRSNDKSFKYSVYHRNFETAIDVLMLKLLSSEKPSNKKLWELIKTNRLEAKHISGILSFAIDKAYNTKIKSHQIYNAMNYMQRLTRIMQSTKGRRKRFMELIEDMTIGDKLLSSLIHNQEVNDGHDYLNLKQEYWHLPWDDSIKYNNTFTDLFDKAISDGLNIVNSTFSYFRNEISKNDLLDIIGNNSLSSGIDCSEKVEWKFSKIIFEA